MTSDWSATLRDLEKKIPLQEVRKAQATLYEIGKAVEHDILDYEDGGILTVTLTPTIGEEELK